MNVIPNGTARFRRLTAPARLATSLLLGATLGSIFASAPASAATVSKALTGTSGVFTSTMLDAAHAATFSNSAVLNSSAANPDYAFMWNNCRGLNGCPGGENRYAFGRLSNSEFQNQRRWNTIVCGTRQTPFTVAGGNVSYDTSAIAGECYGIVVFIKGSSTSPWQTCSATMTVSDRNPSTPTWDPPSCVVSGYGENTSPVSTVSCPAGQQPSGSESAPCQACPPNTYKPIVGAGMCTTCPPPETFGAGAAAGTVTFLPNSSSTACDASFACDTAGYTVPSGATTSNLASLSCTAPTPTTPPSSTPQPCTTPGQYRDMVSQACVACPSPSQAVYGHPISGGGTWTGNVSVDSPGEGVTTCRAFYTCPSAPGTFSVNFVSDSTPGYDGDCAASCGSATHPLGTNAALDAGGSCGCKPGFYLSGGTCTACPAGTFKDSIGNAISCTSCPITGVTPIGGMGGSWHSVTSPVGSTSVSACCASYYCGSYGPFWRQTSNATTYGGADCSTGTPPSSPSCGASAPANPPAIAYGGSPYTFQQWTAISPKTPVNTGGPITSCSASPPLPAGLTIGATNCMISGNPSSPQTATNHTIVATNSGGAGTTTISITVSTTPTYPAYPMCSQTSCASGSKITSPDINTLYNDASYCGNSAVCTYPTHNTNTANCGGPGSTCGDCYTSGTSLVYVRCKQ